MQTRDYAQEFDARVAFIKDCLAESGCAGLVFNNSGGKDCALVGIMCKAACADTVGLILPCGSKQNTGSDMQDALALARQFDIESRTIDLEPVRAALLSAMEKETLSRMALTNIAPRLRMVTAYAVANEENRLVAGTGNKSEFHMGYFTKWGDGAYDFNPISDLTVTEIYEFLRFLGAPQSIIDKAPSAGLFDGQTDEGDMGVSYAAIDRYITTGEASEADRAVIDRYHGRSGHKRGPAKRYQP